MRKIPYIVTAAAACLAALFAILNTYWAGFVYFVLASLLLLSLFWGAWQIYKYFTDFQKELEERFKFFKVQKINSGAVTAEVFEQNLKVYQKEFKKKSLKDKLMKWAVIAFCFAVALTFLLGMIYV